MLDQFEQRLPPDIRMERAFDQSISVANRLNRLYIDFAIAVALVSITLLPLGLRAAGIVMVSIPLSLAVGIALVSYYFWKAGRLLVRSNIAILTIMLAICIMMLVQGVGFECPPERSFNGTVWRNFEANTPALYAPQPGPLA